MRALMLVVLVSCGGGSTEPDPGAEAPARAKQRPEQGRFQTSAAPPAKSAGGEWKPEFPYIVEYSAVKDIDEACGAHWPEGNPTLFGRYVTNGRVGFVHVTVEFTRPIKTVDGLLHYNVTLADEGKTAIDLPVSFRAPDEWSAKLCKVRVNDDVKLPRT